MRTALALLTALAAHLVDGKYFRLELEGDRLFVTFVINQRVPRIGLDDADLDRPVDDVAKEILAMYEAHKDDPLWTPSPCENPVKDAVIR